MEPSKKLPARFYRNTTGSEPVREWLKSLAAKERRVIGKDVQKVECGWPRGLPGCRPLGGGLGEVRSDLPSRRTARVYLLHRCQPDDFTPRFHQENPTDT